MVNASAILVTIPSTRFRTLSAGARDTGFPDGRIREGGAAMPTYAYVPAFAKGVAFPGVRAWSPPV